MIPTRAASAVSIGTCLILFAALAVLIGICLILFAAPAGLVGEGEPRTLTVFAAASLADVFKQLAADFESSHPGVRVRLHSGGSNMLALQIREGAACDVFASAALLPMNQLREAGEVADTPAIFARNQLVVVAPRDNPARIRSWTDAARPGVKLVLAAPGVPAGDYAREVLSRAGLLQPALRNLVSNEPSVRAAFAKVVMGEADAGFVYVSDARARPGVAVFAIPDTANVIAEYPIAVTRSASDPALARAFREHVLSRRSQALLRRHGFIPAR